MQKEHVPFLRQYVIFAHSPNKFSIFRTAQIINMTASGHSTRFLTATQKSDHITQYWKPFIGFQYNIELLFKSFCYLTNLSPVHALLIWCRSCNYSQSQTSVWGCSHYWGPALWNKLPADLRSTTTVHIFRILFIYLDLHLTGAVVLFMLFSLP